MPLVGPHRSLGPWKTVPDTFACSRQQAFHQRRTARPGRAGAGRRSSGARLRLLGAFPDRRQGAAARRGWGRKLQFVTGDSERALLFDPVPIGERGGLDLEGQGLVRRVDGNGAEVEEAPPDDHLVFLGRAGGAVIG